MKKTKRIWALLMMVLLLSAQMLICSYAQEKIQSDGGKSVGIWISDVKNGPGLHNYKSGARIEGFWSKGLMQDSCIYYNKKGEKAIYTYADGKSNGLGVAFDKKGTASAGIWKDNKKTDEKVVSWENSKGTVFYAKNKEAIENGKAIAVYSDGSVYNGVWKDGLRNGWGAFYYANGNWYMGEWKDGKMKGAGYYFSHDDKTSCLFVMGIWDGAQVQSGAVEYYRDNSICVRSYKDKKYHGPAAVIYPDGSHRFVEYKNDELVNDKPEVYEDGNGNKYVGTDGEDGFGLRMTPKGDIYIGTFTNRKANGYGFYFWSDNFTVYEGKVENAKITDGTIMWLKGDQFTGTLWENSTRVKDGVFSKLSKERFVGSFDANAKKENGKQETYNLNGTVNIKEYKDGTAN